MIHSVKSIESDIWLTFKNMCRARHTQFAPPDSNQKAALSGEQYGYGTTIRNELIMPEIARFYGIIIKLFFGDHSPPHFHAVYGEHIGMFNIDTLEMIEGDLPNRAKKLVVEWASKYKNELMDMWDKQEFRKLPPLE